MRALGRLAVVALLAGAGASQGRADALSTTVVVRWVVAPGEDDRRAHVEIEGLSADVLDALREADWALEAWTRLLAVTPGAGDAAKDLPAMLGDYSIAADSIRFRPAFPLDSGRAYEAVFHPDSVPGVLASRGELVRASFRPKANDALPSTTVTGVYPSADVLPENLLKFYLHFSAPMRRGESYQHIHLLSSDGEKQVLPFLELDEELWDPSMTRLTLFIDPGRIKRELLPRLEEGPAIEAGQQYRLVIDDTWLDARGAPLAEPFQKAFSVGAADHTPPDPGSWDVSAPLPETRDALVVRSPDPLDHALAQRMITVLTEAGTALDGEVRLTDHERTWAFTPSRPWARGTYGLGILAEIEDLAGNNIGKPFEVDLFSSVTRRITNHFVRVEFTVR